MTVKLSEKAIAIIDEDIKKNGLPSERTDQTMSDKISDSIFLHKASIGEYCYGVDFGASLVREMALELISRRAAEVKAIKLPESYEFGHGAEWLPKQGVIKAIKAAGGTIEE